MSGAMLWAWKNIAQRAIMAYGVHASPQTNINLQTILASLASISTWNKILSVLYFLPFLYIEINT